MRAVIFQHEGVSVDVSSDSIIGTLVDAYEILSRFDTHRSTNEFVMRYADMARNEVGQCLAAAIVAHRAEETRTRRRRKAGA